MADGWSALNLLKMVIILALLFGAASVQKNYTLHLQMSLEGDQIASFLSIKGSCYLILHGEKKVLYFPRNSAKNEQLDSVYAIFPLNGNQSLFNACECLWMFAWVLHEASKLWVTFYDIDGAKCKC